ncbi:MAG TPA: chemotaxis protein CheB [Cytophagaceae bacterium]|nr:chemotaxis protein CheB [Cytophagaceae bacterium]
MTLNITEHNKDLYIIAIGASAGGMEAIHLLFDHTPEDGASYVIIQHLSPDHKSFMAELLAKHSKLKIFEAENDMYIEPNCVYLMPRGKNMTISNRRLVLADIRPLQPNTAIDIFLNSLAENQGNKSIAVILSGTGTDGTKGIAAIKKSGGLVIAQDPESAKFNGMPNSAIESGNVDFILAPQLIPEEIIAYLKRDALENNFTNKITENDETALLEILNLIQQHTPLDFTDYKRPTIIRRIVIRMTRNKISTLAGYIDFLKTNPSEINILAKEFLISVTKFFRDTEAFEIIKEKVIPEITENKLLVDTLKIWIVGCATGEEAYSFAILIIEHLTEIKKNLEVKIFASDIDKAALLHAAKGVYAENITKDVSEERLNKFFIKQDNKYKIRDSIRKMIIFADHDIVKQPPYGKIDLISCRNLLIYVNPLLQKKILTSLHFCLNLGGYLFLGPSESLGDLKKSFTEIDKKWKIYKSTEVVRNLRDTTYNTPTFDKQLVNSTLSLTSPKSLTNNKLIEIIDQTLLEESGYEAGICVDRDFKIIQSFGNYEKYLLPKIFNFNLLEMLPEELSIATSTTLRKALNQNKKVIIKEVNFKRNESIHSVNVFVKPFLSENTSVQRVILVLFGKDEAKEITEKDLEVFNMEAHTLRYLEDMKNELAETKQKLKDAYDALEVSNDNISSYNEELISSNEEMQSTNEELQSVNEELQTVNNEYQLKIKELAELNDDLNNYFKGTINGQLYVDNNLIVRKFTPSAIKQINLKESDVGRPLSDISTNIKFGTLIDDINNVILASIANEKEIQTTDGRWYQMVILPYIKEQNNQNDGAIITFNDITELKRAQDKLTKINADHDTFIYSASHDLKGPLNNVSGLIASLKDISDPENIAAKEITGLIDESVTKLKETINELSDITKIENEIDERENIILKDLLEEVKFSLKDKLLESNAKINIDLKEPEIPFSKKNLRSILLNILSNAIKYRSPDRELELNIRTEKSNDFIILSVQDNGLGLDKDKIGEIFLKFKRRHDHVEGSGIGLFLVKKIITNAGGKIAVASELGKGSTFKVCFKK